MQFMFILRSLPRGHNHQQSRRTIADLAAVNWVRDRGLDHAVEKERNLKPLLNLKNFIKSEPSKSIPLSIISQNRQSLGLPFRPIEFIRKFPSVFEEFLPGGIGIHPHVKLTSGILDLDAEEQLIYQSDNYKQQTADRLLKLLMIGRINKIPLQIVDRLKWDLGLPHDYTKSIVPEFPDCFQVTGAINDSSLELVCWSNELAVSVMEKKAMMNGNVGFQKGMPLAFPLCHSRGFEMDKKYKKWVDEWQKLPYLSPYENASHLQTKSDEPDKWAVAVMHELLHLFVPKKTDRNNILYLGEYLGLRSRFKRAMLNHPGIFYLSSKIGTHTVMLKEAYKRDLLIEIHPLMGMRYKYVHLMNMVKEGHKPKIVKNGRQPKSTNDSEGGEEAQDNAGSEEHDDDSYDLSDSEVEDDSNDDYEENENKARAIANKNVTTSRGRTTRKIDFQEKRPIRTESRTSSGENPSRYNEKNLLKSVKREEGHDGQDVRGRSRGRSDVSGSWTKFSRGAEVQNDNDVRGRSRGRTDVPGSWTKFSRGAEVQNDHDVRGRSRGRSDVPGSSPKFSKTAEGQNGEDVRGRSRGRSDVSGSLPKFSKRSELLGGQDVRGRSRGRSDVPGSWTKFSRGAEVQNDHDVRGRSRGRSEVPGSLPKFSKREEVLGGQDFRGRARGRSDVSRTRGRSNLDSRASAW